MDYGAHHAIVGEHTFGVDHETYPGVYDRHIIDHDHAFTGHLSHHPDEELGYYDHHPGSTYYAPGFVHSSLSHDHVHPMAHHLADTHAAREALMAQAAELAHHEEVSHHGDTYSDLYHGDVFGKEPYNPYDADVFVSPVADPYHYHGDAHHLDTHRGDAFLVDPHMGDYYTHPFGVGATTLHEPLDDHYYHSAAVKDHLRSTMDLPLDDFMPVVN